MTEAIYFVVERRAGRECATLHRDHLQLVGTAVYKLRLDKLPDGARWAAMPLAELYALYCGLRDQGKLPPENLADPPRKSDPARRLLGDYWEPAWVHDRPYPVIALSASEGPPGGQPQVQQPGDGRDVFLKEPQ